jgi:hypothetical protein
VAGGGAPAVSADPESYSGWRGRTPGGRGRHAAITRNLGSLANYRSWADRMKGSFTDDPKDGTVPPPSGSSRR